MQQIRSNTALFKLTETTSSYRHTFGVAGRDQMVVAALVWWRDDVSLVAWTVSSLK
jgi:hypothetical protein